MGTITSAVNLLPGGVGARLNPVAEKLDLAFSGSGPRAIAARTALFAFTVRIVAAALAYVSQILLARWMGAYDYGIYAVIWTWMLVLTSVCALGLPTGYLRFIPDLMARGEHAKLRRILFSGLLVTMGAATLLAASGIAFVFLFPDLFGTGYGIAIILGAICLPMKVMIDNNDGVARAFDWPDLAHLPPYIARPILVLLFFFIAIMMGFAPNVVTGLTVTIFSIWLVAISQMLMVRHRLNKRIGQGKREGEFKPWLKAALPMLVVDSFLILIINTDIIVAGFFVPPDEVAVYFAAAKTLAIVHIVYFAVRAGTAHKISGFHSVGDRDGMEAIIGDMARWTFWPSVALAIMIFLAGDLILSLFGEGFTEGRIFLAILLAGTIVRSSIGPAEAILTMANEQKLSAKIYGFVFVCNVALNLILIPTIGLIGAAIATALSWALETLFLAIAVKKRLGFVCFIFRLRSMPTEEGGAAQ